MLKAAFEIRVQFSATACENRGGKGTVAQLFFEVPALSLASTLPLTRQARSAIADAMKSKEGRDSSVGIATPGWTVRVSNPGWDEIFPTR